MDCRFPVKSLSTTLGALGIQERRKMFILNILYVFLCICIVVLTLLLGQFAMVLINLTLLFLQHFYEQLFNLYGQLQWPCVNQ